MRCLHCFLANCPLRNEVELLTVNMQIVSKKNLVEFLANLSASEAANSEEVIHGTFTGTTG